MKGLQRVMSLEKKSPTPPGSSPLRLLDLSSQTQAVAADFLLELTSLLRDNRFIGGEPVAAFEEAFADFCGVRHCVGLNSGTDALRLALIAAGVKPDSEVITSPFSFIATSESVSQTGRLVLADIDPETYTLCPKQVRERITPQTRAVLPVHIFGLPADMPALLRDAQEHHLVVIEDACQAHGAAIGSRRVGGFGQSAAFSFYPTKNLGAFGDAGALTTQDETLAERVRSLRNHGQFAPYLHREEGYNSRLDSLQAAVLLLKLRHLEGWNQQRRALASAYRAMLAEVEEVRLQKQPERYRHCYHLLAARVERRDELLEFLRSRDIEARAIYPRPTHLQEAYRHLGHREGDFPVAEAVCREVLCFPLHPGMGEPDARRVSRLVKEFYAS